MFGVENMVMFGIVLSVGVMISVMNVVRLIFMCIGIVVWLMMGVVVMSVSICMNGYRNVVS